MASDKITPEDIPGSGMAKRVSKKLKDKQKEQEKRLRELLRQARGG